MRKYIGTTLIIVSLCVGLFVTRGFDAFAPIAAKTGNAVITLTNASQDVGAIDVYIDHQLVKANISTADPAVSFEVVPGNHLIDILPTGQNTVLIKTTEVAVVADRSYNLTLTGLKADWSVALVATNEVAGK